jgi:hypothetical protein
MTLGSKLPDAPEVTDLLSRLTSPITFHRNNQFTLDAPQSSPAATKTQDPEHLA